MTMVVFLSMFLVHNLTPLVRKSFYGNGKIQNYFLIFSKQVLGLRFLVDYLKKSLNSKEKMEIHLPTMF